MMHDTTLNRTSTGLGLVNENNWHGGIDGYTTKTEPPQPIPRFNDVLDLLIQPEASSVDRLYMIVDIKVRKTFICVVQTKRSHSLIIYSLTQ